MLEAIGVSSVDALFEQVPARVRLQRDLDIPPALSEPDLIAHLAALAGQDADPSTFAVFLGAGVYRHFSPSLVDQLLLAVGVLHGLHAVPAGDLAGHAAGDLRVPDAGVAS